MIAEVDCLGQRARRTRIAVKFSLREAVEREGANGDRGTMIDVTIMEGCNHYGAFRIYRIYFRKKHKIVGRENAIGSSERAS